MRLPGLTENHERSLLAGVQYAAKLIRNCEEILAATEHPQALSRYAGELSPPQRKIAGDYLRRLEQQLLRFLGAVGLTPPAPSIDAVRALGTAMIFLDDTFEEMRGRYLRGYGEVSPDADRLLDGLVSQMQALVREVDAFVSGAPGEVLRQRADRLPDEHPIKTELQEVARIITEHALIDLRPALGLLLDRALDDTFEVAVVGRVSSGKSTLLNALLGSPVLPTGVLPVTAFPTRISRSDTPRLRVWRADGRVETPTVDRIDEFVTEAKNPGNEKRLARLLVEYPSERLPDGVTFVDTPGLGSIASGSALQTFAYLPRCDHATFLFEATAPLSEEDLELLAFLQEAGIATSVLLSKTDLLSSGDLDQVRAYTADQLRRRLGRDVDVRPISAMAGHETLLTAWIGEEIMPLGDRARRHAQQAMRRRVEILRRQAANALVRQTTHPTSRREQIAAAVTGLRDEAASLERASRELLSLREQRESIVEAALKSAHEAVGAASQQPATQTHEALRAAFMRPAQHVAETVAQHLTEHAKAVRDVLVATSEAEGASPPDIDTAWIGRDVPLIDLPPIEVDLGPPWWARASQRLMTRWQADRLRTE